MYLTFSYLEATQTLNRRIPGKLGVAGICQGSHTSLLARRTVLSLKVPSGPIAADRLGGKQNGTSFQVLAES